MSGKAFAAFAGTVFFILPSGIPTSVATRVSAAVQQNGAVYLNEGVRMLNAGRYQEAAQFFRSRYSDALSRKDHAKAVSSLNNLAGCYFATFQYREAMRWYLEAKRLAEATGGRAHLPSLSANISSLYLQLGDVRAAQHAAEEGLGSLPAGAALDYRALLMYQLGQVYFRLGDQTRGAKMYREGIEEAARRGDIEAEARGWDRFGWELLFSGDTAGAERALVEAFRLRRLARSPSTILSYPKLGLLKLAQGDLKLADVFLERAVEASRRSATTVPPWSVYHARGELRMAQGRTVEALDDFRTALNLARRWKLEVLPADAVRIAAGVGIEQISASFIRAGNRFCAGRPNRALAEETLAAAEENRAWALRSLLSPASGLEASLPPEYWETMARMQRAEVASLATGAPSARREADKLRSKLTEMETRAGLAAADQPAVPSGAETPLVTRIRQALHKEDALFVFHAGGDEGWAWAVTASDFRLYRIPPRAELSTLVLNFRQAVLRSEPEAVALGEQLHGALFAKAPRGALAKRDWIVVADDVLHHAPMAALVAGRGPSGASYLIEKHSLRFAPAAAMLTRDAADGLEPGFIGVGDAVFNTADARWQGYIRQPEPSWRAWLSRLPHFRAEANASPAGDSTLELARLPGSLAEVRACADAWGARPDQAVLLTGRDASKSRLERELARRPGIVHLATHVLRNRESAGRVGVALSINQEGQLELLTPELIRAWRHRVGLVVLSACSSGNYPVSGDSAALRRATTYSIHVEDGARMALPGEGMPGLSRAWLAGGARAVVASLWPTPDDTGQLFCSFYSKLRGCSGAGGGVQTARALQHAQIEMLHSANWRSQPRHWAAFFITGKE